MIIGTVATMAAPDGSIRVAQRVVPLAILADHPSAVRAVEYLDGWVPNSYRWPAPGTAREWRLDADTGEWVSRAVSYDRKRSYGVGPDVVVYSADGGRLDSY